jgi:hypothetical protein
MVWSCMAFGMSLIADLDSTRRVMVAEEEEKEDFGLPKYRGNGSYVQVVRNNSKNDDLGINDLYN